MGVGAAEQYAFTVEWLDPNTKILWKYDLIYYPESSQIEMYDIKNKKTFLKKCRFDGITMDLLYLGNVITVFSRQLKLVNFADEFTRSKLERKQERTLGMIKPDAVTHLGEILDAIRDSGLTISQMKMCHLTTAEAEDFYAVHRGKPFYERLTEFMSSGRVVALELNAEGAIKRWRELLGPTNSSQARTEAPSSLRARFGKDNTFNACHGSDAPETAAQELAFFFSRGVGKCDLGQKTTLAIIKPHAFKEGQAGAILTRIQQAYDITALQLFNIDLAAASDFYEVYRGVISPAEYSAMVEELTSGPFIALEVKDRDGASSVEGFREFVGPADPEVAKVLRPGSLRAHFGHTKAQNAVHCTDLEEDGELEVTFFFTILQQQH